MDTPVKGLSNSISRFVHLVSCQNVKLVALQKDYKAVAFILKTLKPVLDDVLDYDIFSDEMLCKECEELDAAVNMAREFIEDWSPKTSKIYSVLQSEPLLTKIQGSLLIICTTLGRLLQSSSPTSSSTAIQRCMQEIQSLKQERVANYIEEAMTNKRNDIFPCTKSLTKIMESLDLTCSQELLKENIALGKERTNAEASSVIGGMNTVDQIVDLVSNIRDCMVKLQRVGSVSVPAYFCCPLSSKLMVDPVIVASGQTYDRFAIQKWLDNGLTVCPKTRQKLAHTNVISNYTVKAMIATWCDENKVKLPINSDRTKNLLVPLCSDGVQDLLQSSDPYSRSSRENGSGFEKQKELEIGEITIGRSRELSYSHSRTESTSSGVSSTDYAKPEIVSETPREITSKAESRDSQLELATASVIKSLVEGLKSLSVEAQTAAAQELRLLAKHNVENRSVIGQSGAIAPLVSLLYTESKQAQEHAVTALLNLSIDEANKVAIAESGAIEPLIHVLRTGSNGARENSAAALFSLSVLEEYKAKIGRSGAVKSLVDLLGSGTLRGKKDAATALFNLSIFHENKARIVQSGAVKHLVRLLDPSTGMADKSVALLANLSTVGEGRTAIVREGGIPLLVEIVDGGSLRGKENAASVLMQLCLHSSKFCTLILQEGAVPPLVALSQSGTPRAKEKAQQLLSHFRNQREGTRTTGKGKS